MVKSQAYKSNPYFCTISTDSKGRYACGSTNGEIRLYRAPLNKRATCKYPGLGDPIAHIESSKDGSLLLATCPTYLILLPTSTKTDNLYDCMLNIKDRPTPIKLGIKLEHLQFCKIDIKNFILAPAKFD